MKKFIQKSLVLSLAAIAASQAVAAEVNVYSSRKEALIKPLLERFTEQTGIQVNLVTGKDDALIARLQREGKKSPADLLITADAGRLYRAKEAGLLQAHKSKKATQLVPAKLQDPEGLWLGLTQRARPIFYVKGKVNPAELSSYEALMDAKWKGRICIRSSSNIYNQSLIASMVATKGEAAAQQFANGLVANMARSPAGGDTDQLRAAAAGVCDIAIANTYYFGRLATSAKAEDQTVANQLAIFWPNQAGRGVHVNVSGIGLTQSAKHKQEATQLIEFMLTPESQHWYSQVNNEYPVVKQVMQSKTLMSWGAFKADNINLTKLGVNNRTAVKLMDRAGWK